MIDAKCFFFFQIRLASVESSTLAGVTREPEVYEGHQFSVTRGDYSPLMKLVVEELKKAKVCLLCCFDC